MTLRLATAPDAPRLAELHAAAFPLPERWNEAAFRALLALPGTVALLGADGVGMAMFRVAADEGELLTLAVHPDGRRRGTASALLDAGAGLVAGQGARTLFLEVSERNKAALALYGKSGFAPSGRRPRYYADGADAVLMACPLGPR